MKLRNLLLCVTIALLGCSGSKDAAPQSMPAPNATTNTQSLLSYQDEITQEFLNSHLSAFSADSMEGRETGLHGQKKAAQYLSAEYKKLGLKPAGDNGSYLQKFDVTANRTDSVVYMTYKKNDQRNNYNISQSNSSATTSANYIRQFGGDEVINADIVFAGFGMQNEELGIDNFKSVDIKGKWVMIFENVPQVLHGDSLYSNRNQFTRARFGNIIQKGVAGILMIPDMNMDEYEKAAKENSRGFGKPSGMQLAYRAEDRNGPAWSYNIISPAKAAEILELHNGASGLTNVKDDLKQHLKDVVAVETGYGLTQIPYIKEVTLETENVAAVIEGADPQLKDQYVVLSAHYDHVGIGAPDSTGDTIYNGANDDGSGTIGVLSAARAFSKAKENGIQPRRSILFLSVTGEEKGLLGSRYYSDHPIFPIKQTVADINTDMIGRIDPEHEKSGESDYIYIIGSDIISSDIDSLLQAGNASAGKLKLDKRYNDLTDPNQFYRRSDHWNFGRLGVPFVFFFNGVHADYHRPSDEVDKINFPLMAKTARTMYATTVMVANADSTPKVDNQEFIDITKEN